MTKLQQLNRVLAIVKKYILANYEDLDIEYVAVYGEVIFPFSYDGELFVFVLMIDDEDMERLDNAIDRKRMASIIVNDIFAFLEIELNLYPDNYGEFLLAKQINEIEIDN